MAMISAPPAHLPVPQTDYKNYDYKAEEAKEEAWVESLRDWCRQNHQGDLVGEEIREGRGDGYARYMVMRHKPFTLIHLPLGDAWSAGAIWERGVTLSDVRSMVNLDRELRKLFTSRSI